MFEHDDTDRLFEIRLRVVPEIKGEQYVSWRQLAEKHPDRCWPLLGGADIPIVALNDAPYTFIEAKRVVLLAPGAPVPSPYADFPY